MKNLLKPNLLPFFTLACGILGLILRAWLFATGMDEKGLLVANHPAAALSWVLAAVVILALFLSTRGLNGLSRQQPRPSIPGCIGALAAAIGIAATELSAVLARADSFSLISGIFGIAAAASLCVISFCHLKGKAPAFGLYLVMIVYFLFHLVCQYRQWSWAPQLQVYAFPLLASVLLMLSCFHRAALNTSLGNWGSYLFFSQAAALFCCLAVPGIRSLFYPSMAVWMFLSPYAAGIPAQRKEE